jgi:hypothetical protein
MIINSLKLISLGERNIPKLVPILIIGKTALAGQLIA